eukprot:2426526-Rhodomonas_salina.1
MPNVVTVQNSITCFTADGKSCKSIQQVVFKVADGVAQIFVLVALHDKIKVITECVKQCNSITNAKLCCHGAFETHNLFKHTPEDAWSRREESGLAVLTPPATHITYLTSRYAVSLGLTVLEHGTRTTCFSGEVTDETSHRVSGNQRVKSRRRGAIES